MQQIIKEQRLGLTDIGNVLDVTLESRATFVFTGQADVVIIGDGKAICLDYKTGRSQVPIAQDNPQLASLAVLVSLRYNVKSVRVAIVAPWAGKPTVADYDENSLALAKSWLLLTLDAARSATQDDLRAGEHCKWCKAAHCCPALRVEMLQEIEVIDPASIAGLDGELQRKAMWARSLDLTPAQHTAAYRGLKMLQRYADAIEGTFKQRVEAGEIPGYTTREKKGRRSISDVGKAFAACAAHGVTAEAFTAECSIGLGAVKELLKTATRSKGKALDKLSDEVLTGCVDIGKGAVEIVKIGQLE